MSPARKTKRSWSIVGGVLVHGLWYVPRHAVVGMRIEGDQAQLFTLHERTPNLELTCTSEDVTELEAWLAGPA